MAERLLQNHRSESRQHALRDWLRILAARSLHSLSPALRIGAAVVVLFAL
jgi:hypothetical protein